MRVLCSLLATFLIVLSCGAGCGKFASEEVRADEEAKEDIDKGGNDAKKDEIDLEEVDRLIIKLGRGRGRIRKKAIDELISVGKTSLSHAKQLVSYLNEHSQKESSPKIKATIAEVIEELSEVPVIRPSVRFGNVERSFFLLDNRSDLLDLVRSADGISEEAIDFGKSLALGCFAGPKPYAPVKAEILRIRIDFAKSSINVFFKDTPPVGGVLPVVTYPADIALIPRDESFSVVAVIDSDTGKQLAIFYPYSGKDVAGKSDKKLVEALKGENTFLARAAALELGKSKNKEFALKTLREFALDVDQNVWVRKAAIKALGTIDDKTVVPALSEFCRTIRIRNRQDGKDSWQRRALYKAAITALADYPGLDSLSFLLNEFRIGPIFGGVREVLKKRLDEIEKIAKDPESIEADSKVKDKAMEVYIHFHGSKAFPVLIDYAAKTGRYYYLIKKSLPADLVKGASDKKVLELAREWYKENEPYIVGSTSLFYVDTNAKAAGVPVKIWRQIDSEKRENWSKLTDEEKEKAIELAEERLKKQEK